MIIQGGFARCFELVETETHRTFAGKVIAKAQLQKSEQKEKMSQEIAIHRSIRHRHVVEFYSFFEDKDHIYILLEICNKRSLMEMHKRRKTVTEAEVRYFVKQIAMACKYLHDNKIVHRDLKLGNLFINDAMEIKVGDFGLATRITNGGERKMTLCGTPNYIAPEVLTKKGHSFEVDVWSLGCIVYTLLVGKPPFETSELKETYRKIRHNDYTIPSTVPYEARVFIEKMLQPDPHRRPTMEQILNDSYLTSAYVPSRLPASCLTTAPRFDQGRLSIMPTDFGSPRRALIAVENTPNHPQPTAQAAGSAKGRNVAQVPMKPPSSNPAYEQTGKPVHDPDVQLRQLKKQLANLLAKLSRLHEKKVLTQDMEDPVAAPVYWVSKWVDYTEKYGIGYQLCDNSIGVLFNDYTRIVLMADENNLQYIEKNGNEVFMNINEEEPSLTKKITLLKYFKNYMNEHLLKTGDKSKQVEDMARLPYLHNWFRSKHAIVFHLTNGTLQINYFQDHIKIILCPHMEAVTYVDVNRGFYTYKFSTLAKEGCTGDLASRLEFAFNVTSRLIDTKPRGGDNKIPNQ